MAGDIEEEICELNMRHPMALSRRRHAYTHTHTHRYSFDYIHAQLLQLVFMHELRNEIYKQKLLKIVII